MNSLTHEDHLSYSFFFLLSHSTELQGGGCVSECQSVAEMQIGLATTAEGDEDDDDNVSNKAWNVFPPTVLGVQI